MSTPEIEGVPTPEEGAVPSPMSDEMTKKIEDAKALTDRDFTGERDDRVIPLIKRFISEIGNSTIPVAYTGDKEEIIKEEQAWQGLVDDVFVPAAIEQKLQKGDLVYLFQLLRMPIEMLQSRAMLPENPNDPKFFDAAMTILKLLGNQETLMVNFHDDELGGNGEEVSKRRADLYESLYFNVVETTIKLYDIKPNEIKRMFEFLGMILQKFENVVQKDMSDAYSVAERIAWGVPDMEDIDIHTILLKLKERKVE